MRSVDQFLYVFLFGLATKQTVLGRSLINQKAEENDSTEENDISNSAPQFNIELKHKDKSFDNNIYYDDKLNVEDREYVPYTFDTLNDLESSLYKGSNYFMAKHFSYFNSDEDDFPTGTDLPEPESTSASSYAYINQEISGDLVYIETATSADQIPEQDDYVLPDPEELSEQENLYVVGIPAQFQNFPMFNSNGYKDDYEYEEEEKLAEKRNEEMQNKNVIEETAETKEQKSRIRRALLNALNLRNVKQDIETNNKLVNNFNEEDVIINNEKNCGSGRRGRRPPENGGSNGNGNGNDNGNGDDGANGVDAGGDEGTTDNEGEAENLRLTQRKRTRKQ